MKGRTAQDQLFFVLGVLGPGSAVLLARFLGSGPSEAAAAVTNDHLVALPDAEGTHPAPTGDLAVAWSATQDRRSRPFIDSPLASATRIQTDADPRPGGTRPRNNARTNELHASLTSIALVSGGPLAVIDGRPRRVGDEIQDGWRIEEIDPRLRVVAVRHDRGERVVLTLRNAND